jgi:hypothetical protein
MMKKEYGVGSCVLCAMTALGVIGPTKRLGGLERSRDDLAERDALRAQISPFRYAPASPSRSHTPTTANKEKPRQRGRGRGWDSRVTGVTMTIGR